MNQNQKDNVIAIVSSSLLFCHKLAHDIKALEPTAKESKAAYEVNPVVNNLTNAVVLGIDTVLKESSISEGVIAVVKRAREEAEIIGSSFIYIKYDKVKHGSDNVFSYQRVSPENISIRIHEQSLKCPVFSKCRYRELPDCNDQCRHKP